MRRRRQLGVQAGIGRVLTMNQRDSFVLRHSSATSDSRSFLKAPGPGAVGPSGVPVKAGSSDQESVLATGLRSETPPRVHLVSTPPPARNSGPPPPLFHQAMDT